MKKEDIAKYAYENVPFYQKLIDNCPQTWNEYPIVDKKMLLEDMDANFSPQYMMDYLSDELEHVFTSGSAGDCLEIFWKKEQNIKSLLPLWKKRERYYGITPRDRRCYFFTTKIVDGQELQSEKTRYGLGFNKMDLSEVKVIDIYERILEFNPKWLIVQPSIILLFMRVIIKYNLQKLPELKYIELNGERFTKETKEQIATFFDCKVASQYGCYEVNSIAYECPCGNLHVMSENVYAENIGNDDICITSLHNKVMPFVRYKIGDRGKVVNGQNCPCGSKEPIIELSMARENDWIYNVDGTVSHSDLFCHVIDQINLTLEQAVLQYQIIQVDYNKFEVYLVLDDEENKFAVQDLFVNYFRNFQLESNFNFFFVDYLYPSEKTGKLAWFISKVKGEENNED